MSWEPVIGLEVHAQLLTDSKLFCACSARFGAGPNEHVCPVCTGFPGVLPVLNRRAVDFAIRTGLALGCEITPVSRWARKNYFYPDLPKGYQISQYDAPVCRGGAVTIPAESAERTIRLVRIHMEEDAGKSLHDADPTASLVDLNRAGVPLLEIVSQPDLRSPAEAGVFLRELRAILEYLEVCDGNMEEGSLRCDANVSIRPTGASELGTRTEIKNLNSFRAVERALSYEIERQIDVVETGQSVIQETLLWDADREETRSMRTKEEEHDYRYFPEPDLPPLEIDAAWVERVRSELPELPAERRRRFVREYGLPEYDAGVLTARRDLADYYEAAVRVGVTPKTVSNWVMEAVMRIVHEKKLDQSLRIDAWPVAPEHLGELVRLLENGTISGKIAKTVFEEMTRSGKSPGAIVEEQGLRQVTDDSVIAPVIDDVLAASPDKVAEYRAGKEKLFGYFVGKVMKATGGKANPKRVNELLRDKLSKP